MEEPKPGEVLEYIQSKNLDYKEMQGGKEIAFPCPFNGCDDDKRPSEEFHCNIDTKTGQYYCHKCSAKGNLITLKRHFGDLPEPALKKPITKPTKPKKMNPLRMADNCHRDLPDKYRQYFKERGITDENIDKYKLGYGEFYGKNWLTIPIIENGQCSLIKLRQLPESSDKPKYRAWPSGGGSAVYGETELQRSSSDSVLLCGGELDKIIAEQMNFGMPVICGTAGEATFKDEWIEKCFKGRREVYICLDNDETGKRSTVEIGKRIAEKYPNISVFKVTIPEKLGEHSDLTDANLAGYTTQRLLETAELIAGASPIDVSKFSEMTIKDLIKVLSTTIKFDDINKVVVCLGMLSTYTDEDQMNVFLAAQSSSGKSYLVQQVLAYFPETDVKVFGKVTPTAFYYAQDLSTTDENGLIIVDLERKILIFLDQMDYQLQENLRPLLSHDKKEITFLNTNRTHSGTNNAKEGILRGFPSTFFCSANLQMDEQEQTRAFVISPETSQAKIEAGIDLVQEKSYDKTSFDANLANNPERKLLADRIIYIKGLHVKNIIIPKTFEVEKRFKTAIRGKLQPRHQRDIQHLNSLIKAFALLNAPTRERRDDDVVAKIQDVDAAFEVWKHLNRSQEYGISPETLDFYENIVLPCFNEQKDRDSATIGVSMNDLLGFCAANSLSAKQDYWRKQHLPSLIRSGLISEEKNPNDKRNKIFIPQTSTANTTKSPVQNINPGPISFDDENLTEEEKYYVEHADELDPKDSD